VDLGSLGAGTTFDTAAMNDSGQVVGWASTPRQSKHSHAPVDALLGVKAEVREIVLDIGKRL
jgi:hypothetical protein